MGGTPQGSGHGAVLRRLTGAGTILAGGRARAGPPPFTSPMPQPPRVQHTPQGSGHGAVLRRLTGAGTILAGGHARAKRGGGGGGRRTRGGRRLRGGSFAVNKVCLCRINKKAVARETLFTCVITDDLTATPMHSLSLPQGYQTYQDQGCLFTKLLSKRTFTNMFVNTGCSRTEAHEQNFTN